MTEMIIDGRVIGQIEVMILTVERIEIDAINPGGTVIKRDTGAPNTVMIVVVLMNTVGIQRVTELEGMASKLVKIVHQDVLIQVKRLSIIVHCQVRRNMMDLPKLQGLKRFLT